MFKFFKHLRRDIRPVDETIERYKKDGWKIDSYRAGQTVCLVDRIVAMPNDKSMLPSEVDKNGVQIDEGEHVIIMERLFLTGGRFCYLILHGGKLFKATFSAFEDCIVT